MEGLFYVVMVSHVGIGEGGGRRSNLVHCKVCYLLFAIPLHAARRAVAAVVAFQHDHILPQTGTTGRSRGPLSPLLQ